MLRGEQARKGSHPHKDISLSYSCMLLFFSETMRWPEVRPSIFSICHPLITALTSPPTSFGSSSPNYRKEFLSKKQQCSHPTIVQWMEPRAIVWRSKSSDFTDTTQTLHQLNTQHVQLRLKTYSLSGQTLYISKSCRLGH